MTGKEITTEHAFALFNLVQESLKQLWGIHHDNAGNDSRWNPDRINDIILAMDGNAESLARLGIRKEVTS